MTKELQPRNTGCVGMDGSILGEDSKILGRWMENFKELLNESVNEEEGNGEIGAQTTDDYGNDDDHIVAPPTLI